MMHNLLLVNEPLNRVGDFELAAWRRLDRAHRFINCLVKQIHTYESKITWWIFWLLNKSHNVSVFVDFGNTKLFWILNMTQQNLCSRRLWSTCSTSIFEVVYKLRKTLLKHVVTEVHHKVFITQEVVRYKNAVCKT